MAENRVPALAGSVLLHAAVLGAGLITLPLWAKPIKLAEAVPVTIVSRAPPEPPSATVQAPIPTPETTPEPAPQPAPTPPPAAAPTPAPPKPEPKPLDLGALAASLPESKAPTRNTRPVDLAALASSLPHTAARGPARPAAAPVVNPAPPKPLTGDEKGAMVAKLIRLWNLNCDVEGADKVVVKVEFHLSPDGHLTGPPTLRDKSLIDAGGAVSQAAAMRALAAVSRGEPYSELPRDRYQVWKDWVVNFNAKQACANP